MLPLLISSGLPASLMIGTKAPSKFFAENKLTLFNFSLRFSIFLIFSYNIIKKINTIQEWEPFSIIKKGVFDENLY